MYIKCSLSSAFLLLLVFVLSSFNCNFFISIEVKSNQNFFVFKNQHNVRKQRGKRLGNDHVLLFSLLLYAVASVIILLFHSSYLKNLFSF